MTTQKFRPISAEARAALLHSLRSLGVDDPRANEAADLACNGTEQAMARLFATTDLGSDVGVKLMALEIAAQLIAHECIVLLQIINAQAEQAGATRAAVVTVP